MNAKMTKNPHSNMRYIGYLFGMIKAAICVFFSVGHIRIRFPIKYSSGARLTYRKKGRIQLEKHVSIGYYTHLAVTENAKLIIGNYSGIGNNSTIVAREKIQIGDNVMMGPNVCIYDHDHIFTGRGVIREQGFITEPVTIEDNVWIGAGVIILKGVTIKSGSVIAAGTVIAKDVEENTLVRNKREVIGKRIK